MRTTFTRDFYIPKGAIKISDKQSDAVAYLVDRYGKFIALLFCGKAAKPAWHYSFKTEKARADAIARGFASWRATQAARQQRQADRKAATHNLEVGHVLSASWGYEQTNVNFYQVTKIISAKMVELRPIASMRGAEQTSMSGTVLPALDKFTGEPMRKRVGRGCVKIDSSRFASFWNGKPVFESSWH